MDFLGGLIIGGVIVFFVMSLITAQIISKSFPRKPKMNAYSPQRTDRSLSSANPH